MTSTTTPKTTPAKTTTPATLAEALAAFQRDMPRIAKANTADVRSTKGNYSYSYADLTDITEAVMPSLAAVGLSVTSHTDYVDGRFMLITTMRHTSGEDARSLYPLPDPTQIAPQQMGSSITYARRYLVCAMTGIAPGGDDDDAQNAAPAAQQRTAPQRPAPQRQAAPIAATPEYLPGGIYDLGAIGSTEDTRVMYQRAGRAGHLNLIINDENGNPIPFGDWLTRAAQAFVVPDEEKTGD